MFNIKITLLLIPPYFLHIPYTHVDETVGTLLLQKANLLVVLNLRFDIDLGFWTAFVIDYLSNQ